MLKWFDRFPGRLERELEEFRDRGLNFQLDERQLQDQGRVMLHGLLNSEGGELELEVAYPDLFPYLRPEVYAPGLHLPRHQNPYQGNLCLLDRPTAAWKPSDTAAWLVDNQVRTLLSLIAEGGQELRDGEAPQGEPASVYFGAAPGTAIFVPEEALVVDPNCAAGSGAIFCSVLEPPRLQLRGLLGELVTKNRKRKVRTVATADQGLASRFGGKRVPFRWVRLSAPPEGNTPFDLLEAANAVRPGFGAAPWQSVLDGEMSICGFVFKEEVEQGVWEDAWIFVVSARPHGGEEVAYIVRGERLTPRDLGVRIPALTNLSNKTVAIIGVGALGAQTAVELARSQVGELRLLDHDFVEPGNSVRWPMGLSAVGFPKVDALGQLLRTDHPFTNVELFRHRLGESAFVRSGRTESELDLLERLLDGVDLVIDASAEIAIQQLIATSADECGLPQLYLSATEGALGGIVASVQPYVGGCWMCLQTAFDDGRIHLPPHDSGRAVQPRGCASLTFTGASFDLAPIASQGARVAVEMMGGSNHHRVDICSISAEGARPPAWTSHLLKRQEGCSACALAEKRAA